VEGVDGLVNGILNRNLAATLLAAIVMTTIAPPAWAQTASTQILGNHRAFITSVTGTVEVKAVGQQNWVRAAANREVKTGDRVRTAANSKCRVKVSDVGEFEVIASTEIAVGNLQQVKTTARAFFMFQRTITRDDVGMDLKSGDMRSSFHRAEGRVGNYNVYTPVAVAGVRGTKFELDLEGGRPWYERLEEGKGDGDENALTTIVLEGEVEVQGGTWTRNVAAGQQLTSTMGNSGNPTDADPNRLLELQGAFVAAADQTAPTFEGLQTAERAADGAIALAWNAASDDSTPVSAIVYDLFEATTSRAQDLAAPAAVSNPGITQMVIRGLSDAVSHYFIVRARDEAGNRDMNTKEVAVLAVSTGDDTGLVDVVTDQASPTFGGASAVVRLSGTEAMVEWLAASDDVSSPAEIVYDIYASRLSGAQNYSQVTATSDSGATSFTLSGLEDGVEYYVVVRARDEAGNRDANTEEVSTYVYTAADAFDTNAEIVRLTNLLFDEYEEEDLNGFMEMIDPAFAGTNNAGNALNYSTLFSSLSNDMSVLSSVAFTPAINSLTYYGEGRYGVKVTWSAVYRFEGAPGEYQVTQQTTDLIWSGQRPFQLSGWSGSSLFGVIRPTTSSAEVISAITEIVNSGGTIGGETNVLDLFTGDTSNAGITAPVLGPAPTVASVVGMPDLNYTGTYQDFGPYRIVVTGADFQDGARIFELEDNGIWTDVTTPWYDFSASVFFQNPSELWIDVAMDKDQWEPGDPATENISYYVENPDGQTSNIVTISRAITPGPLTIINAYGDRAFEAAPDVNPYYVTVEGYNLVGPFGSAPAEIYISQQGRFSAEPNASVNPATINLSSGAGGVGGAGGSYPLQLTFQVTVGGDGLPPGSYDLVVKDARGQIGTFGFTISPAATTTWSSNVTLTSDYNVAAGQTLNVDPGVTVSGTGFRVLVDGILNANSATFQGVGVEFKSASAVGILQTTSFQNTATASGAAVLVSDGNVSITGGSISNNPQNGIYVNGGNVTLNGTTLSGNGTSGAQVMAGSLNLSNVTVSTNGVGLYINGPVAVYVSGGTFSSNSSHNIYASGGSTLNVGAGAQLNSSGGEGLLIAGAGGVNLSNVTISNNSGFGVYMDGASAGCILSMNGTTISGSPIGIQADAGTLALNGSVSVTGGSITGIELRNSANLTTSGGSNVISGTGFGTTAALRLDASFTGSASITDASVRSALFGIMVRGGGTLQLTGAGAIVETCNNGIDVATSSCNIMLSAGAVVRNNTGYGLIVADCGSCSLNNVDVLSNGSFGVARPSGVPAGAVALNNVLLQGNNGQGGNDLNTSPPTPTSSQYENLTNPPNTVTSPR
jgi:hypothetical protein